ncbi:MAG TPA: hypothetical protein VF495_00045, partial [Phenylobacterium sp.]
ENRYLKATFPTTPTETTLKLAVSTAEAEAPSPGVAITALSDRGQAALIQATGGKPPIKLKPAKSGDVPRVLATTSVTRSLVVSFRPKGFLAPGDRIDAISVALQVDPRQAADWRITSWTQATNGKETLELGKSTRERSEKFTAETGLKIGKPLVDTSIGFESSRSSSEEASLKDTTVFDAAVDENGVAWLEETAAWRESLAHNLTMDAVISVQGATGVLTLVETSDLATVDATGARKPAKPDDVLLSELTLVRPADEHRPVCGTANLSYRVRHVIAGAATFTESDDEVTFAQGTASANYVLAPPSLEPVYGILLGTVPVSYQIKGKPMAAGLNLASLDEAFALLDWLRTASPKGQVGNGTIGVNIGGVIRPFTAAELAALKPGLLNPEALKAAREALATGCPTAAARAGS